MHCTVCQSDILAGQQHYTLRIDLFAGTELEIPEEELKKDQREDFEKLMEQFERMDADDIAEENERIFERYTFTLCPICRARFHGLLKNLRS